MIGKGAFVGSNSTLVAPVKTAMARHCSGFGDYRHVPPGALESAGAQENKPEWVAKRGQEIDVRIIGYIGLNPLFQSFLMD